jgi:tetratricopeptide (TPR) repeat protein
MRKLVILLNCVGTLFFGCATGAVLCDEQSDSHCPDLSEHQKVLDEGKQYLLQNEQLAPRLGPVASPHERDRPVFEHQRQFSFPIDTEPLDRIPEGIEIQGDYYSVGPIDRQIDNPLVTGEQLDSAQLSAQKYEAKGKFEFAERLYERILKARTLFLKQSQIQKASTLEGLHRAELLKEAAVFEKDKNYQRLLTAYDQALSSIAYARDLHPSTRIAILNPIISKLETVKGECEPQAAELHLRAQQMMNSYRRSLQCLEMADQLSHTAWLLEQSECYAQAEKLYRQALAIKQKNLGLHDPDTLAQTVILARLCADEKKYDQADKLYEECLASYEEMGRQNCSYAVLLENYADMLNKAQKHAKAGKIYSEAQAIYKKIKASPASDNTRKPH